MENVIKKYDNYGNIVYLEIVSTGFIEEIEYTADGKYIIRIYTKYPNGLEEIETFNPSYHYRD
jgi:hypothetical protein